MKIKQIRRSLAILLALAMLLATLPTLVLADEYDGWTSLTADFSQLGHEISHRAMGCLYGIGEEDVPSVNLLTPIRPYTFEQKAPDGLQHPTGDAALVGSTLLEGGGQWIQVGCPDAKSGWYYEESPFESEANYQLYKEQIVHQASRCVEAGLSGHCVYNLFNETNNGQSWDVPADQWLAAWKDFVEAIRAVDPLARFSGPGYANFDSSFYEEFIRYTVENDCAPFQITTHNLFDDRYNSMESEFDVIRKACAQYGLTDYELCANEYGTYANLGNPGGLIKYVSTLEDNEASGCLAFWHVGNNLCDIAADANEGNGVWWMYKMYADMSGITVKCTPSSNKINLYGMATIDEAKQTAYALFGGSYLNQGSYQNREVLRMTNLDDTQAFQGKNYALVTLQSTSYQGSYGPSEEPYLVYRRVLPIVNGSIAVPVEKADGFSAYFVTAIPVDAAASPAEQEGAFRAVLEAEAASLSGGASTVNSNGTSGSNCYPASGGRLVNLPSTSANVSFTFEAPRDGWYELRTVYALNMGSSVSNMNNHRPRMGKLDVTIDGDTTTLDVDNTLLDNACDNFVVRSYLSAGSHSFKLQPKANANNTRIDCLYVTYTGEAEYRFDKTLEAEEANPVGSASFTWNRQAGGFSGTGCITGLKATAAEGGARFVVYADEPAMYKVALRYQGAASSFGLYLNNTARTLTNKATDLAAPAASDWASVSSTLYLEKGINIIDVACSDASVLLDSLNVTKAAEAASTTVLEAENALLSGNAATAGSSYASGGRYVRGLEAVASGANAITFTFDAPAAGKYRLDIWHSNSELFGNHGTNVAMIDRYFTMELNEQRPKNIFCRNTYSDDCFRVKTLTVELEEGSNTIKLWNDDQREYRRDRGGAILLDNFAPNLDKIALTPITDDLLIVEHEHDTVTQEYKVPTCITPGYSGNEVCRICGETQKYGQVLAATGHTLLPQEGKEPGCLEPGWAAYDRCEKCSYSSYRELEPTGHIWDEGVVTIAPTETSPGLRTLSCTKCDATKTKRIPRLGSTLPEDIDFSDPASADQFELIGPSQSAIVSGTGLPLIATRNAVETCNDQNSGAQASTPEDLVEIEIEGDWTATLELVFDTNGAANGYYQFFGFYAAEGDDYQNMAGIRGGDGALQNFLRTGGSITADSAELNSSPGFASSGATYWLRLEKEGDSYTCLRSSNGEDFTEMFSYADTGIEAEKLVIDAYTGMTAGYKFTLKRLAFEDNGSIPEPPVHEHSFGEWTLTTPATCTEPGLETRSCSGCDETETRDLAALGHDYKEEVTAPTCTEKGFSTYTCARCDVSYKDKEAAALGHDYKEEVTAPTCTDGGYSTFTCARCDNSYKDKEVEALGHEFQSHICTRCDEEEDCPAKAFTDAPAVTDWAHAGIDYCVERELMKGTGETLFSPANSLTRAQIATILYRIAGEPEVEYKAVFTDVADNVWYTDAILWAVEEEIVTGYPGGTFAPNKAISREQIATILYRYAGSPASEEDLKDYPDAGTVSDWAKDAMAWAVENGLINGVKSGDISNLAPRKDATRAQFAAIIMRFQALDAE